MDKYEKFKNELIFWTGYTITTTLFIIITFSLYKFLFNE